RPAAAPARRGGWSSRSTRPSCSRSSRRSSAEPLREHVMGEMSNEGANLGAGIDLSQFYQVFFEEAAENLDRMEQQLLDIDIEAADDEELNSIFRCAHSVKGGAATFGFSDVAELTHQMETLLDKLRRHELAPTAAMVDVLLQSGDALRAQLARHQGGGGAEIDT